MIILAVETSARVASVALSNDGYTLAEFTLNNKMTHSKALMPLIEEMLNSLEFEISEVDVFAVSEGPGSFTGLRIGVSTVKAFAYTLDKPIIMVSTLEALAYNVYPNAKKVCAIMDARNNQVFGGVFKAFKERYVLEGESFAIDIEALLEKLKIQDEEVVFVGDGAILHQEVIKEKMSNLAKFPLGVNILQRASLICYLAKLYYDEGNISDAYSASPFYLRKSSAQQELEKKKGSYDTKVN